MAATQRKRKLQARLFTWYRLHKRDFLWRSTENPYVILLSEVMLQQTQASRVQEKLPFFLKKYPTIQKLARSTVGDVIRAWRGMGYNNRAVRLHALARSVMDAHRGRIPRTVDELLSLPGIGPYTARAVACFAFGERVEVVDVNVRRVLSRITRRMKSLTQTLPEKEILHIASSLLPVDAYTWNQALMEFGATVCTSRSPGCTTCPLRTLCASAHLGSATSRFALRNRTHRAHMEPIHAGMPNRLWRGKVVKAMTSLPRGKQITLPVLGAAIKSDFHPDEAAWLIALSRRLEQDGILEITGKEPLLHFRLPDS